MAFRVWAPHAEAVSVAGTFNGWNPEANPLDREETGCWYGDVPGAKVGDEYRYHLRYRGESLWRIDPRARAVTDSKGNSVVHDPRFDWEGDDFTPEPIERLVLYELHVGTFNAEGGRGTLASAAARLGHLRELGFNGVTLMPVTEFVGDRGWGYDMSHLYAVESSYGGPQALKEFVKAAHREGIAVFLDVVYNHFGVEDNILWRFDGWHRGKYGGIYFYQDAK
ncbi:MAG TPA: alpha-amylase family glycosyl hydrolase, partial [Planctomycetaceae bacterium]